MITAITTISFGFLVFGASSFVIPQWVFGPTVRLLGADKPRRFLRDTVLYYGLSSFLFFTQIVFDIFNLPESWAQVPTLPIFDLGLVFLGVGTIQFFRLVVSFLSSDESKKGILVRYVISCAFIVSFTFLASLWLYNIRETVSVPLTKWIIEILASVGFIALAIYTWRKFGAIQMKWKNFFFRDAPDKDNPIQEEDYELRKLLKEDREELAKLIIKLLKEDREQREKKA